MKRLLAPFSLLYGSILALRNLAFDRGLLTSESFETPVISVGNLSVGGTGKSPMIEYLIELLAREYVVGVISRGYGRSTKGMIQVSPEHSAHQVGDEPLQFKQKFPRAMVVVCADRVKAIKAIKDQCEVILLDDAFQHRAVQAGLSILVTPFDDLFVNDFVLPAGNLREWKIGTSRADVIVVSKCPHDLDENERNSIKKKLNFDPNRIFFSRIEYGQAIGITTDENLSASQVLIVSGIGNPKPLVEHYQKLAEVNHMKFPDHHAFSQEDIHGIHEKFDTFASRDKAIVTTEKDFMRLKNFESLFSSERAWYYQPIEITFYDQSGFNELVNGYISKV